MSEIIHVGINPYQEGNDHFIAKDGSVLHRDYCGNPDVYKDENQCDQDIRLDDINADFKSKCTNKTNCLFDMSKYVKSNSEDQCNNKFSKIYLQFSCSITGDE